MPETVEPSTASAPISMASGADQTGVRLYNERLILSLARRFGRLSKIEVARMTGLSVQSTSAIMNRLQADGLLRREAPMRGRVGQPTVPFSLDPEGAFSLGLKIGRRSCDLVLIDFCGVVRRRAQRDVRLSDARPRPGFRKGRTPAIRSRPDAGAAATHRRSRRRFAVSTMELVGRNRRAARRDGGMAFVFDSGGRSVDSAAFPLRSAMTRPRPARPNSSSARPGGSAISCIFFSARSSAADSSWTALSTPAEPATPRRWDRCRSPLASAATARPAIDRAALRSTNSSDFSKRRGRDPSSMWRTPERWDDFGPHLERWIEEAAFALAQASIAAISVIDVAAIVIDGAMPIEVRQKLCLRVAAQVETLDRRGLSDVKIISGVVGADARAIGGAALPLIKNFARDREVLFKDALNGSG